MGLAMMTFLHLYMHYTQPLFIQALMGLKALYDAKPVAIHVLNKPAEGDLKRPFKAGGGMFGGKHSSPTSSTESRVSTSCNFSAADPQTDKAAIEEAEKKIGQKEE